ncbi:MAG: hypothetical protein ACYDHY_07015 [Acidiferrobacterales bacterium]
MTPKEVVEWSNKFIKEEVFPTIRELVNGKRIQLTENDSILRQTLMMATARLEQKAKEENVDLQGTEVISFPEMIAPGKVVLNMMCVSKEEADLIREELQKREIRRAETAKVQEKKDELPN